MNINPLVSIILPTYKRADKLAMAIDSVLNQSYYNIKVIVVDDNNPETEYRKKTEVMMEQYLSNERVIYIKHEKNRNGAAARNTGINIAKGKFITFLDDDDYYLPDKVKIQVEFLQNNVEFQAVYCGRFQNGIKIIGKYQGDLSKEMLSFKFMPTTPAMMFRVETLKELNGFDEKFIRHQDVELLLRFFRNNKIGFIPIPLIVVDQTGGENEAHGEVLEKTKEMFFKTFENEINKINKNTPNFKRDINIGHYVAVFCDHLQQKNYKLALKIYLRGIKYSFHMFNFGIVKHICIFIQLMSVKRLNKRGKRYE